MGILAKTLVLVSTISMALYAQNTYGYGNNEDSSYQGNSGQTYQYDMSNANDRISYSTDIDAQQRDMQSNMQQGSSYQNSQQDESTGQYGSGVYNGN